MSGGRQIDVKFEDATPRSRRWRHPLKEDAFAAFASRESEKAGKIFGAGSFFSPLLFGKFFDPSDAFPLWEFESDALLPSPRTVEWFQTDTDFVLRAELDVVLIGDTSKSIHVLVENGKILEISGKWKQQKVEDWKSGRWWEQGFVRRLELPERTEWRNTEARLQNELLLEIRIPRSSNDAATATTLP